MLPEAGAEPQAERLTCLPPGADSAAGSPTIARTTRPTTENHIGTSKRRRQPLWMGHSTHSPQLLHPKQVAALTLTAFVPPIASSTACPAGHAFIAAWILGESNCVSLEIDPGTVPDASSAVKVVQIGGMTGSCTLRGSCARDALTNSSPAITRNRYL